MREEERAASHIPAHQPGGGEGAPPRRALDRCPAKAGATSQGSLCGPPALELASPQPGPTPR